MLRFAAAFGLVLIVTGAARAADDEHPYENLQGLAAAHEIAADIDQGSFAKADAYYPRLDGGHHVIAMGNYIYWKIVNLFQSRDRVGRMWLSGYAHRCRIRRGFADAPTVVCNIRAQLTVTHGGRTHRFTFTRNSVQVGGHFATGDPRQAPARRAEMRFLTDEAVNFFATRMRETGILRAE